MNDDKLDKIMTDIAVLLTKMEMVTTHINKCGALPTRVSILEDSMSSVKKIMWGIGSVIGTALLVSILALIL